MTFTELPDPSNRAAAWCHEEPAYLGWHRAMTRAGDAQRLMGIPSGPDQLFAHSVPTVEAIDRIAPWGPLVEIGAGSGYWARLLADRGADIVAYDLAHPGDNSWLANAPMWSDVRIGDESMLATLRCVAYPWPR